MFYSKNLNKIHNIKHCFYSRKNGFSKENYESLNCGLGSIDKKESVLKNLEYVSNKMGCKKESLITLNQIHSKNVVHFDNESSVKNKLTGDSIVSEVKNIGIGILTADCAPVLAYDPTRSIIAAIHIGWKGAIKNILSNTIYEFKNMGSNIKNINIAIGPCIGPKSYEVEEDFFNKFTNIKIQNKKYFIKSK